jgi:hypothetical protein
MSEFIGADDAVSEAYAFVCMHCGYGWEQSYEIEHHLDARGRPYVTYVADGRRVPSPLSRPTCLNCEGHLVRIMRAGRVSGVVPVWDSGPDERRVQREVHHRAHHWSPLHLLHRGE